MQPIPPNLTFAQKNRPKPEIPSERLSDFTGNPEIVQKAQQLLAGIAGTPTDTFEPGARNGGEASKKKRRPESIDLHPDGSYQFTTFLEPEFDRYRLGKDIAEVIKFYTAMREGLHVDLPPDDFKIISQEPNDSAGTLELLQLPDKKD